LGLFGVSFASGEAFGWIVWTSQTLMIVIFGAISFLSLPLWYSVRKKQ
ncbi:MAG: TIGR00374 family protein, partial [Flavobacteriaceae bacterium]